MYVIFRLERLGAGHRGGRARGGLRSPIIMIIIIIIIMIILIILLLFKNNTNNSNSNSSSNNISNIRSPGPIRCDAVRGLSNEPLRFDPA